MGPSHHRGYSLPRYYDVAFNFRDIGAECDALAQLAQRRGTAHRTGTGRGPGAPCA